MSEEAVRFLIRFWQRKADHMTRVWDTPDYLYSERERAIIKEFIDDLKALCQQKEPSSTVCQ